MSTRTRRGKVVAVVTAISALVSAQAWAHDPPPPTGDGAPVPATSPELEVLSNLTFEVPGFDDVDGMITDVWAHGDYAYLGAFDEPRCSLDATGVRVVDIADPTAPELVSFIPAQPGTRNNDVKVIHLETRKFTGDVLVVSQEPCNSAFVPKAHSHGKAGPTGQGGVSLWDVTDPAKPRSLTKNFTKNGIHNTFLWQDGPKAYMAMVDDVASRDLIIADITNPGAPKVVARTGWEDWPDGINNLLRPGQEGPGEMFLHDLWVQKDPDTGQWMAYLSYWDAGLVILDVSVPSAPVFLGDSDYAEPDPLSKERPAGDGHVSVPSATGDLVLLGDEDFAPTDLRSLVHTAPDGDPDDFPAAEQSFGPSVYEEPGSVFTGTVIWSGGTGCTAADIPAAPSTDGPYVALIQRGVCFFQDKAGAAAAKGYDAYIVANDADRGDDFFAMGASDGGPYPDILGAMVGNSSGEAMKVAAVGAPGGSVTLTGVFDGWGYLRLIDTSDPAAPVEIDQFATENVFTPGVAGDRTMHNVVVDGSTNAYISWYAEGMRLVSFADGELTETAHFIDEERGSNFWGVYLHTLSDGTEIILGSDRDTGLWIFADPISANEP